MNETPRYQPLSPLGLAAAFAALALLGSLSMGMPFFGYGLMGPMMGGPYGGYPRMGWGFGVFGFFWLIVVAALGGAIAAWVYNAIIGVRREAHGTHPGPNAT